MKNIDIKQEIQYINILTIGMSELPAKMLFTRNGILYIAKDLHYLVEILQRDIKMEIMYNPFRDKPVLDSITDLMPSDIQNDDMYHILLNEEVCMIHSGNDLNICIKKIGYTYTIKEAM